MRSKIFGRNVNRLDLFRTAKSPGETKTNVVENLTSKIFIIFLRRIGALRMNFGSQIVHRNLNMALNYSPVFVSSEKVHPKPCLFEVFCKCFLIIYILKKFSMCNIIQHTPNFGSQIVFGNNWIWIIYQYDITMGL